MSSYNECKDSEECKTAALDRLKDAFASLKAERYTGALYMAGYVIELGIKAEFFKLANREVSFDGDRFKSAIEYLMKGKSLSKEIEKWLKDFSFPPKTYRELLIFLQKIANFPSVEELTAFSTFTKNRSQKQKGESFHNLESFLEELEKWKKLLDDEYALNLEQYKLSWDVNIRYSNDKITEETAKKSVKISLNFLKNILKIKDDQLKEIEKELESTNEEQRCFNEDQME